MIQPKMTLLNAEKNNNEPRAGSDLYIDRAIIINHSESFPILSIRNILPRRRTLTTVTEPGSIFVKLKNQGRIATKSIIFIGFSK